MSPGRVALVGAGPGDPSLLTIRAAELLKSADVVAYDELVSEAILTLVPDTTELLPVGRRIGRGSTPPRIHPDVLERALRGLFVVRLKAGDPLVFGRGGEEAEELRKAGISFEIVPGISAALGAAAYAAMPLTHRDLSAQVIFSSGHRVDGGAVPSPEVAGGRTLVLYMAAHELASNLAAIVGAGWSPETAAALVFAATTADERVVTGTLSTLEREAVSVGATKLPAVLFVGGVVALRPGIDWRSALPFRGKRIIAASTRGPRLARTLRTLGGEVVELPSARVDDVPPEAGEGPIRYRAAPARWPTRIDLVVLGDPPAARALYTVAPEHVRCALTASLDARTTVAAQPFARRLVRADACADGEILLAALRASAPRLPSTADPVDSPLPDRPTAHEVLS